ncbi:MAG TPA: carbohydrate binding domain-containing protein [Anaerolineae bacterium]|nr:carbohydrate binding domain-containing protein [Anaerolineae bacterium]
MDDFSGWKRVILPFSAFTRSAEQPLDAPNDGLTLSEVWGYSLELPAGSQGAFYLDEVQLAHLNTLYLPLVFRNH